MIDLKTLCVPLNISVPDWAGDIQITGIAINSKKVKKGNLFVAIRGYKSDGHDFIGEAVTNGAVAVVVDKKMHGGSAPLLRVKNSRAVLSRLARRFYGDPAKELILAGVTGTNGKTTVAWLLESILSTGGLVTGLIGTLVYRWKNKTVTAERTTPDCVDVQELLFRMKKDGVDAVVMEVSSHALDLERVEGMRFKSAVFTNLTRDHMDFHGSFQEYGETKARLFSMLTPDGSGVINIDDPASELMLKSAGRHAVTFGENKKADYRISDIKLYQDRSFFKLDGMEGQIEILTPLVGRFNVSNCAAATVAGLKLGLDSEKIRQGIHGASPVPGRMQTFDSGKGFGVVIDYAHTPAALENILNSIREFTSGKLILVFGCGGDRDKGKRPEMGRIAAELADFSIVTNDNPRFEDPSLIIEGILKGVADFGNMKIIPDRKEAIGYALDKARPGDTVIIAGKGHETYQEINGQRFPFDDRLVVKNRLGRGGEE